MNKVYTQNKFKTGDIAISNVNIDFVNGTSHSKGQFIEVTEENKSYFNAMGDKYDLADNDEEE